MFMQSKGCMEHVFAVRQVCEKYLSKCRNVFLVLINL